MKLLLKEFAATFIFLFMAVGIYSFSGIEVGMLGIALGFGGALFVSKIFVGSSYLVSSNPAVSLGQLVSGRMSGNNFFKAVVGQLLGAVLAVLAVTLLVNETTLGGVEYTGLAQNGFDLNSQIGMLLIPTIIIEVVLTGFFVFLVLTSQKRKDSQLLSAAIEGITFFFLYLLLLPVDGGGLNPARSLASAIFYGAESLTQVWVFIVAPLIGGVVAGLVMKKFSK